MASFDESVRMSSDEKFEYECTPCKEDGTVREAKHYCPECSEYYCDSCEISHRRLKATKTHKVLHGNEMSTSQRQIILPVMYCSCNQNRMVEFICEEHTGPFCSECNELIHRKCKISSIQDKSKAFSQSTLKSKGERVNAIESKTIHIQKKQTEVIKTFGNMKEDCKERITKMQRKLHTFVDDITAASLEELETRAFAYSNEIEKSIKTTSIILQRLVTIDKTVQEAISAGIDSQMYVANIEVTENCEELEKIVADIENDTSMNKRVIVFEEDKGLNDISNSVKTLGAVLLNDENDTHCEVRKVLLSMSPIEDKTVSITLLGAHRITGSTFMPNGDLLVCDQGQKSIRLFDQNFKEKSLLMLIDQPWNVSAIGKYEAVITLPYVKKLQFVEVTFDGQLKTKRCIEFDGTKSCYGASATKDEIFISCISPSEIRVLDNVGTVKKKLLVDMNLPAYVSIANNKIYISEYSNSAVVCMTTDGCAKFKYTIQGSSLRGMIIDKDGNVYVCDEAKHCIYIVKQAGSQHETFLTIPYADANPTSVSYRTSDDTLVVTCCKKILVYKLKLNN